MKTGSDPRDGSLHMDTPLSSLIELYTATKQTEGLSPKTISWYGELLRRFSAYAGVAPTLEDLNLERSRLFVASLQGQTARYQSHPYSRTREGPLSPYTIHAYVRVLKAFSSWLEQEGLTRGNVLARLRRPKLPQPMIEILSRDEIDAILQRINPNCAVGARMHLIVLLLLDTGMRANELVTITTANTYLQESYLKVLGKGNKERIVPFGVATRKALLRYLHAWRPELVGDHDRLILNLDGGPLTYRGLSESLKRLGVSSGVPRLHAHLFRHTFAVNYLMNGGDVMSLQRILGHTTLDVTQVYMHLSQVHVQVQHSKFSPVDRLGVGTAPKARRPRSSRAS